MAENVDVLAVMLKAAAGREWDRDRAQSNSDEVTAEFAERERVALLGAGDAVAELVSSCHERDEAQAQYDLAEKFYGEDSNHDEMCAARRRIRAAVKRYVAALARCGGTP